MDTVSERLYAIRNEGHTKEAIVFRRMISPKADAAEKTPTSHMSCGVVKRSVKEGRSLPAAFETKVDIMAIIAAKMFVQIYLEDGRRGGAQFSFELRNQKYTPFDPALGILVRTDPRKKGFCQKPFLVSCSPVLFHTQNVSMSFCQYNREQQIPYHQRISIRPKKEYPEVHRVKKDPIIWRGASVVERRGRLHIYVKA